jgi:hypothetical protein
MPCTVCQHPKRREIDQALIAGSATLAILSQEHGLSTSALHRHKAHLQAKVSRAKDLVQDNLRQGCLFSLSRALEMAMQTAETARAEGNSKVVLQAIQQGTRIIGIILKQDFQLDQAVVFEVLASPQWAAQASLLPDDPQVLAASRQTLTGILCSPCPDNAAPPASPASQEDLELFKENLLSLAQQAAQPKTDNRKLETENRLLKPREKGGKLPGKTPVLKDNNEKYQEDILLEKFAGINLPLLAKNVCPKTGNPKLEALFRQWENSETIPADTPLSVYIYEQSLRDNQCGKNSGKGASAQPHRPANGKDSPLAATSIDSRK